MKAFLISVFAVLLWLVWPPKKAEVKVMLDIETYRDLLE